MNPSAALRTVKLVHTLIWALFAGCIVAIPFFAHAGRLRIAGALIGIVLVEVVVLMLNRWSCPLTAVAARHTSERRDNFDIYLPLWLARNNKLIFGTLYVAGAGYALLQWWRP